MRLLSPSGNGRKTLTFPAERDLRFASTSEDVSLLIVSGYVTKGQSGKGLSAPACACPHADRCIAQAGAKKK